MLENSLRESGNHIRLTAQLIQVKDQTHLWSQDYDYPLKDTLNVEDDVAEAVLPSGPPISNENGQMVGGQQP